MKVCPVKAGRREATQECLDQHPLTQLDGVPEFPIYETPHSLQLIRKAQLPAGLVCHRCVLQWTWKSANSWGTCTNGTQGLGCGPQETFRNCADIRIVSSAALLPATDNPRAIMIRDANSKSGQTPLIVRSQVCIETEEYRAHIGMPIWCQQNCLAYPPHCPDTICTCLDICTAKPGQTELTDFECSKRCLRYPHKEQCPEECSCSSKSGQDFSAMDAVIIDARKGPANRQTAQPVRQLQYHLPFLRLRLPWQYSIGVPNQFIP